jgi:ABC-type bacteriocin/lantibiotic exporter with double-glycine peptidase domain
LSGRLSRLIYGGPKPVPNVVTTPNIPYKYKTRFALLGTVGSGKSTVAAGIVLTAATMRR